MCFPTGGAEPGIGAHEFDVFSKSHEASVAGDIEVPPAA